MAHAAFEAALLPGGEGLLSSFCLRNDPATGFLD